MEEIRICETFTDECTYVYVECTDGSKDRYNECKIILGADSLCIIEDNTCCNWYSRDCLKYFQFIKKED